MSAVSSQSIDNRIKSALRRFADFPKPGIQFVDIFPLLRDIDLLKAITDELVNAIRNCSVGITAIVALEARGFVFGPLVAVKLDVKFLPVRKKGKLPGPVCRHTYDLEYGTDTVEIQKGVLNQTDNVVILDDILATGGTAKVDIDKFLVGVLLNAIPDYDEGSRCMK